MLKRLSGVFWDMMRHDHFIKSNVGRMKVRLVVLISGGRTGSLFFQSLLDGHPEVLQLPGPLFFDEFWEATEASMNTHEVAELFVRHFEEYFDSRLGLLSRHHMLGAEQDQFYLIDKRLFVERYTEIMKGRDSGKEDILYGVHAAYAEAAGENLEAKKILIVHLHHVSRLKVFSDLEYEVLYFLRDPLANLQSTIENWLNYEGGTRLTPGALLFHMDRLVNGLADTVECGMPTYVIQLEKLHGDYDAVMRDVCQLFTLAFTASLRHSTFQGLAWWGDAVSGRMLNGLNPAFKTRIGPSFFTKRDVACIESALGRQIKGYGYPIRSPGPGNSLFFLLPLSLEVRIWVIAAMRLSVREWPKIPTYWLRRVRAFSRARRSRVLLPRSLGRTTLPEIDGIGRLDDSTRPAQG